jgi:hypothetical protein
MMGSGVFSLTERSENQEFECEFRFHAKNRRDLVAIREMSGPFVFSTGSRSKPQSCGSEYYSTQPFVLWDNGYAQTMSSYCHFPPSLDSLSFNNRRPHLPLYNIDPRAVYQLPATSDRLLSYLPR